MKLIALTALVAVGALNVQAGVWSGMKKTGCAVTHLHKCHAKVAKKK